MTKRKADEMSLRLPLVVILGSTGSGKTKLSLDLARHFGGEIIGADSMQIYKALDIITAKATKEERNLAKHHLIDFLEPKETFTVLDYRNRAVPVIDELLTQNKLPIVVGGTNYYIESLLWKILVEDAGSTRPFEPGIGLNNEHELSSEVLHEQLRVLDPSMAERIHPNNKRKILRSIEVLQQKGRRHSDILLEQQTVLGGSSQGGGLRYPNSIIFWLRCEQEILDRRLNARVDTMIEEGLVEELKQFHESYNTHRLDKELDHKKKQELTYKKDLDYTKGIFQSIGFKEFHKYLFCDPADETESKKLLQEGVEALKMVTRRYARKQTKWVTNRFLGRKDRHVPPVYGLDTEDVSKWEENVSTPAKQIVDSFISNQECLFDRLPPVEIESRPNSEEKTYRCDVCERVFIGEFQWNIHMKSNRHKRRLWGKKVPRTNDDETAVL